MRRLSNLSPFDNLFPGVFFSVELFLRRRRPMNITGALLGNPRFHHIKTVLCKLFLTHLVVRSYRAALFLLHVDLFKARATFVPRSRAAKKPLGAFLNISTYVRCYSFARFYHLYLEFHSVFLIFASLCSVFFHRRAHDSNILQFHAEILRQSLP